MIIDVTSEKRNYVEFMTICEIDEVVVTDGVVIGGVVVIDRHGCGIWRRCGN